MQADSSALKKCSENEAFSIKFRPSPNFKHMKKYLKSKFEEDMNSSTSLSTEEEQRAEQKGAVQPPLPPNPPPPFSPPRVKVKQEVVDHEYEKSERAEEPPPPEPATNGSDRPVMCKDFVRGTCTRGSFCIYAHKLDLTQLDGVYRFCRDFENKRCIRPVCYFVHATTFEKEHFMRTGTLPPHATAHLRASAAAPPLPLPPPTHHRPDVPGDHTTGLANMPAPAPPFAAARKRDWHDHLAFTGSECDLDAAEQPLRKSRCCDYKTIRLQHSKAQVVGMRLATQELDDQLEKIVKSNERLNAMLEVLLKAYTKPISCGPWRT